MPIDPSTDQVSATSRRSFLTRTAVAGAVVTAGTMASPLRGLTPFAAAQETPTAISAGPTLNDQDFAAFAAPLELASVVTYQTVIDNGVLSAEWESRVREYQTHHQQTADLLISLMDPDADPAVASEQFLTQYNTPAAAAGSENAALLALADVENVMSSTHFGAVIDLIEPLTAKTVTQVLAVENQQFVLLSAATGVGIDALTPVQVDAEDAFVPAGN